MRALETLVVLAVAATTYGQDMSTTAEVTTDNPAGAKYAATFAGDVSGTAMAGSDPFGTGVAFHVDLSGLPDGAGPFSFHLHQMAVPEDGNCTGTGGHLDPYGRGSDPACDSSARATCEVGDLSGKYGKLEGSDATSSFLDLYSSLNPESVSFFGNRSLVVHNAKGDRIACASWEVMPDAMDVEEGDAMDMEDDC